MTVTVDIAGFVSLTLASGQRVAIRARHIVSLVEFARDGEPFVGINVLGPECDFSISGDVVSVTQAVANALYWEEHQT